MLRKPNGMTYSSYIEKCCNELAAAAEAPMDQYLIYYIRLTKVLEEISSTFGYCAAEPDLELSHQRTQGTVRAFVANVQEIGKSFPPEVYSMPSIMSIYRTAPNMAYEIILHLDARSGNSTNSMSPNGHSVADGWYNSTIRTDMLLSCLDSIKECLDWYASLPETDYERFNLLDTSRISYHLLLLGRLTLSGTPGSEIDVAQQLANVEYYYDTLLAKYRALTVLQGHEESTLR